jgi:hypothetical protein
MAGLGTDNPALSHLNTKEERFPLDQDVSPRVGFWYLEMLIKTHSQNTIMGNTGQLRRGLELRNSGLQDRHNEERTTMGKEKHNIVEWV